MNALRWSCFAWAIARQASASGGVGSAVLTAARRASGLTSADVARSLAIDGAIVRDWGSGKIPLYSVPYVQLYDVAEVIAWRDGPAGLLQELLIAGQCDLLVREMIEGSADYAELPTIGEDTCNGSIARELLSWGFTGTPPDRYRHLSRRG
jgi:hypothetical protein